ncbi:DUF7310 family coiled-coil domain-containing protein [Halomarina litorea]|uniref:DUF7310 family coiled-coil domain-containing protein n=1 Tax=Halomarina litorea TaxID=2961595 RepID=UPI0020C53667|nr:hypothetical protein [Halomarina sp. BCD28]
MPDAPRTARSEPASPHYADAPDSALAARVAALERALTGDDDTGCGTPDPDTDAIEERLDRLEARVGDIDAALLAVRGYVGQVRHVNREVERMAEAALATAERAADRPHADADADAPRTAPLRAPNGDPVDADAAQTGVTEPPDADHDAEESTDDAVGLLSRVRGAL